MTNSSSRNLKARLRAGETLLSTMITIGAPEVAEIVSAVGFDWLFLDGEHGPLETAELKAILQAVGDRCDCLVRVPANDEVPIKKALDLGAAGIIVPQVNTAEQAEKAVAACLYPPAGERGTGLARAHGYGANFDDYVANANDQVLVVVQAEHHVAVENIESIVAVPGIDCIYIGPYDLSASMGKPGQIEDPEVLAAIARVESVCQSAGMPLGYFGVSPDSVSAKVDAGYGLVTVGIDSLMLGGAAKQILDALKG